MWGVDWMIGQGEDVTIGRRKFKITSSPLTIDWSDESDETGVSERGEIMKGWTAGGPLVMGVGAWRIYISENWLISPSARPEALQPLHHEGVGKAFNCQNFDTCNVLTSNLKHFMVFYLL